MLLDGPIDQFPEQHIVVVEGRALPLALLPLDEAAELQGVVLAAGADVVDDQVVVGNLVALFGVVPEPTDSRRIFVANVSSVRRHRANRSRWTTLPAWSIMQASTTRLWTSRPT